MALFGIYASHTTEMCPLNNIEIAKTMIDQLDKGIEEQAKNYKINSILGQYHSGLEHIFLWIVDAEEPHLIEQFCIEAKIASWNAIKIVPLRTTNEVREILKTVHSL